MNPSIQQMQPVSEQEDSVDLAKYLGFLADYKWLIVGIALATMLCGMLYVMATRPVHDANILIQVEDRAAAPKSILGDMSSIYDLKVGVASEMEILQSRLVVAQAVENARLYITVEPKYLPLVGEWMARHNRKPSDPAQRGSDGSAVVGSSKLSEPGLLGYGGYVWAGEKADVSTFNVPEPLERQPFVLTAEGNDGYRLTRDEHGIDLQGRGGERLKAQTGQGEIELLVDHMDTKRGAKFTVTRISRIAAIEALQKALKISEKGKQSGIIGVSLEGRDPKSTGLALNEIGRDYIRQNEDRKSDEAEKSLAFLNKQMPELKEELLTR
ncbi:hypothetical protein D3870_07150 [Noviherbaspirillum cavernae]|uniref:Polysaccharide chain length determinant N-terminal domain-containing protein n=1 Tax=Noviherbaspirillum cavernae TaxID=2320862 RepID=A0A418WZY7_9BURK|nr:Wzz/FepE/Etk N-terminal domain-containing protein [Noviherbaspirillum cavernae]RJG05824.1 hypothetical protein D3870_07150 [Noviherbaspirillum cavernae]